MNGNNDSISFTDFGGRSSRHFCIFDISGLIPSLLIVKLSQSNSLSPSLHFFKFNFRLLSLRMANIFYKFDIISSLSCASGQFLKTMCRNFANNAVDPLAPIGVLHQTNCVARNGSVKALHGLDSSAKLSCQNDPERSRLLMILGLRLAARLSDSLMLLIW